MNDELKITRQNLGFCLLKFTCYENLSSQDIAKAIGCPQRTIERVMKEDTWPSEALIRQCSIMFVLGLEQYKGLSKAEKEGISEKIGATGGSVLGFGAISGAISTSGTVTGLSAAGITSGLGAIGATVGGGMVVEVSVLAGIPIAAGVLGYGLVKGIKSAITKVQLDDKEVSTYWEEVK